MGEPADEQEHEHDARRERPRKPIEVAVIGGGCASLTAAFELTRPELGGAYHVTVYQLGWRLGGKGASGRGPADRIEEHGLHVWLGFYENAFRLIRDCYEQLGRDPETCPIARWQDAFFADSHVGIADLDGSRTEWLQWTALFPPAEGQPGDPLTASNPFTITGYVRRTVRLLQTLLIGVETQRLSRAVSEGDARSTVDAVFAGFKRVLRYGMLGTTAGLAQAASRLDLILQSVSADESRAAILEPLREITRATQQSLEGIAHRDGETRYVWQIIDLVVAILTGIVRFGIMTDPRGFDAINEYECRDWLKLNGASSASVDSAFVRGLFDLAMAYPGGDVERPALAAGQAVRGALRMFFTYRGALFWKMRAGMGDVVFAPLYEVLKRRGVSFRFFHRLEKVRLADEARLAPDERRYVEALEFDVQARIQGSEPSVRERDGEPEYRPLIDVRGLPCWPSKPDYGQLVDGERLRSEGWEFESYWDRRTAETKTLRVGDDFDFVVLGIGVGALPDICSELVASDSRWRDMVEHVRSVPTQAFQIWMSESMRDLGWTKAPVTLSGFAKPFDTWADMSHLVASETWRPELRSIAYFCSVLSDPTVAPAREDRGYPERRRAEVRESAIRFLNLHVRQLWPNAVDGSKQFRWSVLVDPVGGAPRYDERAFDSQYWTANVNPSDRYVLALPGSLKYRISPLDNTYDNLTIAGDWTACGFTEGCVEAAVMSGRLAAHALAKSPSLEAIIGYDHP